MRLSVIIPARNEADNIGPTVDAIRVRLTRDGIAHEIVVVDDGSSDGTAEEVRARAATDASIRLVENPGPHGFGYAVRRGMDVFDGDAVAIMMADGSDSPDDLVRYYYVLRDRAECAFGSRIMSGCRLGDYSLRTIFIQLLAIALIRSR